MDQDMVSLAKEIYLPLLRCIVLVVEILWPLQKEGCHTVASLFALHARQRKNARIERRLGTSPGTPHSQPQVLGVQAGRAECFLEGFLFGSV